MKRKIVFLGLVLALLALPVAACAQEAPAPAPAPPPVTVTAPAPPPVTVTAPAPTPKTVEEFYANNETTLIIPYNPGGGHDYSGRTFASFWSDVTGGPMVVKNMPGGDGIVAMNYVFNEAEQDGLTLLHVNSAVMAVPALTSDPALDYKMAEFNYLGTIFSDFAAFVVAADAPYETMADLQGIAGLQFGASGVGHQAWALALVADSFGLDAEVITGYSSGGEARLAVAKGEIDGTSALGSAVKLQVDQGLVKPPLVSLGKQTDPNWPDTPTVGEIADLTPAQLNNLNLYMNMSIGRTIAAGPGVPADKLEYLRNAFNELVELSGFQRQGGRVLPVWPEAVDWMTTEEAMKGIGNLPQADVDAFKVTVDKYLVR